MPSLEKQIANKQINTMSANLSQADYIRQLEIKLQQQAEEYSHAERLQKTLFAISELASGAEDVEQFYFSLHQIIGGLLKAENFYIALVDESGKSLEFVYFVDAKDQDAQKKPDQLFSIPLKNNTLSTYVYGLKEATLLSGQEIIALEEAGTIDRFGPPACSWLGAPLIANDVVLGIIVVQSYDEQFLYRQWHRKLFDYVSNVIANTLERKKTRLHLELMVKRRTKKLEKEIELRRQRDKIETALLVIAELANSKVTLNVFYSRLHKIIADLIYAENFYVVLKNPNDGSLNFVYYADTMDKATIKQLSKLSQAIFEQTLTAYTFRNQKTLLVGSSEIKDLAKQGKIKKQGPDTLSWLGVPLVMDGNAIGIIVLQSYDPKHIYNNQDKTLIEYIAKPVATAIERKTTNQNLEDIVKQRTQQIDEINQQLVKKVVEKTKAERLQASLYEIANLASGAEKMQDFYAKLHHIMEELFYAKNFYIALLDADTQRLQLKYHVDLCDKRDLVKEKHYISEHSLSSYLLKIDRPLIIDSSEVDALVSKENIQMNGKPFVSWLGVPLRHSGHSIGIMVLQSYIQEVRYESWHMELLEYVSNQIALTLNRKQLQSELERKVLERTIKLQQEIEIRRRSEETQSALYHIANLANTDISLDAFYQKIHQIIGSMIYSENFFIGLRDDDQSISFVYYEDTVDEYDIESISAIPVEKLSKSLTYYVMDSNKPLLATGDEINRIIDENQLDSFGEDTASWLGIPLMIDGHAIGVMVLQSYLKEKLFTQQDLELMIFVGQHVAAALQKNKNRDLLKIQVTKRTEELHDSNKKLKEQIEKTEKAKQLQTALYQIADLASSSEKIDILYQNIHQIVAELIYAKNFYIALYDEHYEKLEFVYYVDTQDNFSTDSLKQIPKEKIEHTATGYVLKTGHSFLKNKKDLAKYQAMGIKTIGKEACFWLGVPLKIDENIIGIIVVQSYDESIKLDEWHQELLEFVSHHIAITLERRQARKALEVRVEERTLELANINESLRQQIKERQRSEAIQAALYNIANLANESLPLRSIFEKIHDLIRPLIYAENFYIALWNEENDDLDWIYFIDSENVFDDKMLASYSSADKKKSFASYIVRNAAPVLADKEKMLQMVEQGHVAMIGPETEFFLGVPLLGANSTIGAMAVQSYDKKIQYNVADQELMNFVAHSIVATIERREYHLQLEKSVEQRTHELIISNERLQKEIMQRKESEELQTALYEISKTPQQCYDERELYTRLHEIISRLMYVESFYIALVDNENRSFNFDYIFDNVDQNVPKTIPIGRTLTSYVYRRGKTVHINRQGIIELEAKGEIDHLGTYSADWVGVPLISAGSIYGIMIVQSYTENYMYTQREVEILNFVSTHIAEALQRKNSENRLRKTYAELANKTKKAEAASQAKSTFLATVSHEIRTPMNGILGLLSLISDTNMSSTQRDYISKITTSTNSLLGIINDILDFSKIEQGKLELEFISFDLLEILDNLIDIFSSRVNEKQLNFTINIDPEVELLRLGDPLRLTQVLINLVGNAVKFTDQGFVEVTVREDEQNYLNFSIQDSGIGIAPEQHQRIFETFTQADDTTTRKFGGSGLGLSICQQLVRLMKGQIVVEGQLGQGSCFSFNAFCPHQIVAKESKLDLSGANVLLVSCEPSQIQSWQNFCDMFELPLMIIEPKAVLNNQLATNSLPKSLSHIFIDGNEHYQDGCQIAENIQKILNFKTPCFILANPQDNKSDLVCLQAEVQYIPKPTKMGLILSLIQDDYDVLQIANSSRVIQSNVRPKMAGCQILVAEDNLINQQVAKEILQKAGANVSLVDNGALAVKACEENDFDVVLMDMQMPVMDGYQATLEIRKSYSQYQLPIIAMTANVMKGDREKCLEYGMNDYIGKPIDRSHLFNVIESYLKKAKHKAEVVELAEQKPIKQEALPTDNVQADAQRSSAASDSAQVFDIHQLAEKFDSLELAYELVAMFRQTHKNDSEIVKQLIKQPDLAEARAVVHKLKGSAGELGINDLHQQSELIESQLKKNILPEQFQLEKFYQLLEQQIEQFVLLEQSK